MVGVTDPVPPFESVPVFEAVPVFEPDGIGLPFASTGMVTGAVFTVVRPVVGDIESVPSGVVGPVPDGFVSVGVTDSDPVFVFVGPVPEGDVMVLESDGPGVGGGTGLLP